MKAEGKTVEEILINLPEDRVEPFNKLHDIIVKNLPKGTTANQANHYHSQDLLPKRIP